MKYLPALPVLFVLSAPVSLAAETPPTSDAAAEEASETPTRTVPALTAEASQLLEKVKQRITHINTQELQDLLAKHPETQLIDVRTPQEITLLGGSIDAPRVTSHYRQVAALIISAIGGIRPASEILSVR